MIFGAVLSRSGKTLRGNQVKILNRPAAVSST